MSEGWLQERKRNHTLLSLVEGHSTPQAKAEVEFMYEMQSGFRANEYNWLGVQWASRGQPEVGPHGILGTLGELLARNKWLSVTRRSHSKPYSLYDMRTLARGGASYSQKVTELAMEAAPSGEVAYMAAFLKFVFDKSEPVIQGKILKATLQAAVDLSPTDEGVHSKYVAALHELNNLLPQ